MVIFTLFCNIASYSPILNYMKQIWIVLIILLPLITKAPPISERVFNIQVNHLKEIIQQRKEAIELQRFLLDLRTKESTNRWKITNRYGYMGYYQFGNAALQAIGYGYITTKKFRKNPNIFPPELQHKAAEKLLQHNSRILKPYYRYIRHLINGIVVTESGLLAAAHLGGAGNVIKFLDSCGEIDFADGNGTLISDYLEEFGNYKIKIS